MHSIILCGGSGTRLWPLSRKNFPKQFLTLAGEKSLIQETFSRFRGVMPAENIVFVTNKENYYNVLNQIKEIEKNFDARQIIVEPASLNTLPAAIFAIKYLIEECGEVLAAAGKTQRWGWFSCNPDLPPNKQETNIDWLRREMKDLREVMDRLEVTLQ